MRPRSIPILVTALLCAGLSAKATDSAPKTIQQLATKTTATANNAPAWIKHGAYVYRVCVPEDPDFLVSSEAGIGITCNLLDGSIEQIPLMTGVIGDDHTGICNWDGIWPYWSHVSYRAKNWDYLRGFMQRVSDKYNTKVSFHVNLTDVNVGLRAYPETRAYFKKLVETKSIYRRDYNPVTRKRDIEPPYVPQEIPANVPASLTIFALVNYKNFWDSGLAKTMIDDFYSHLPYSPPVLYVDVLTLQGGNFTTGYPTAPLDGSEQTQLEGVLAIAQYLRSKGTEIGTEGDRNFMGEYGTYGWLHCQPGYSPDDYSKIKGAAGGRKAVTQHVMGNTGCFVVSPVGSTPAQIAKVRAHYAALLAGSPITRKMPGPGTWHLPDRGADNDEFNMFPKGGGDPFRGDWIDLVNDFYLTGIQELYYIGKGDFRTAVFDKIGYLHLSKFLLTDPAGKTTEIPVQDCFPPSYPKLYADNVRKTGNMMLEGQLLTHFNAPQAGKYRIKIHASFPGRGSRAMNVYVNNQRQLRLLDLPIKEDKTFTQEYDLGELTLNAGDNILSFDPGPIYAKWNDGTEALWETPSLGKGFKVTNGDVTFADDYDRMWPDTWSGRKKIYFYSWDGTARPWKLPQDWATEKEVTLYPLTPEGRGQPITLPVADRTIIPKLLPQVPYILVPKT
ncbi:MAG: glycoside hydrolase family 101 beta sandwich domain-containing protein [Chthoniobacteraceae bacterium]